jgi:hypothetical protein
MFLQMESDAASAYGEGKYQNQGSRPAFATV